MKKILLDIDGVLLNWLEGFYDFCEEYYHVIIPPELRLSKIDTNLFLTEKQIADGAYKAIGKFFKHGEWYNLRAYPDALKAIKKLQAEGYSFDCISSAEAGTEDLRMENLEREFGIGAFDRVIHTDFKDKGEYLSQYPKGLIWVEDKLSNALLGEKLGMKSVFLNRHRVNKETHLSTYFEWDSLADDILSGRIF